jgi:hypothetical protein
MSAGEKQPVTPEWIARTFGSATAWRRSLTGFRFVKIGPKRKPAIHIKLLREKGSSWRLPCLDGPIPAEVRAAVAGAVLGIGPRPRVQYRRGGEMRIAIGRPGEPADRLRVELVQCYGLVWTAEIAQADDALAEYVATGGNYRFHARRLGMRDQAFLAKSADPAEVEQSVVLSDRQFARVWRIQPTYELPAEGDLIGDPGEWATDSLQEVVIGDPGGEVEASPPVPMAIPKADGRGKANLYFGFGLEIGGGRRFRLEDFEPPLRIALGGQLNRDLGFGGTHRVDERVPYAGDGYHWGRNMPLAPRIVEVDRGPVCRVLIHPNPEGQWHAWLGGVYEVPDTTRWETWTLRQATYDRERKKAADREANATPADPLCVGGMAEAA